MRGSWWLLPAGAALLIGGMIVGIMLGRDADRTSPGADQPPVALEPDRSVRVPALPQAAAPPPAPAPQGSPPTPSTALPPAPTRPPDQEALAFVRAFMQARMDGDAAAVSRALAPELGPVRLSRPGAPLTGYELDLLGSGDLDSFIFRTVLAVGGPPFGGQVVSESLRVTYANGLQIVELTELAAQALTAGATPEGLLFLRRGEDRYPIALLSELPERFAPAAAGGSSPPQPDELPVGREGWWLAVPSLSGEQLLWVTRGSHPLLGISKAEDGAYRLLPLLSLTGSRPVEAAWAPGGGRFALALQEQEGRAGLLVWEQGAGSHFVPGLPDRPVHLSRLRWGAQGTRLLFDLSGEGIPARTWQYDTASGRLVGAEP